MEESPRKSRSIADGLLSRIEAGVYPPGSRLPSLRRISESERCSVSTAVAAVDLLASSGRILSLPRSGNFVRSADPAPGGGFRTVPRSLDVVRSRSHGLLRRVLEMAHDGSLAPFHAAVPHPSLLPLPALGRHVRASVSSGSHHLGSYTSTQGSIVLRRELVRLHSWQGLELDPSDLVVTNGCMEALSLAVEAVSAPDQVVAIESPTFFGLISLLEAMGRQVVEIPCSPESGLRLDLLETTLSRHPVACLVVSPDVQNPTGAAMDLECRRKLVCLARKTGMALIEDSIYSHGLFASPGVPPLAALWPDGTVHCSSASKIVSPGLRIGWMAPGRWTERVIALKSSRTLGGPPALQEALAGYLGSRDWPRHRRRIGRALMSQVQTARERVLESFPEGTRVSRPAGGFFLWLEVPGLDSLDLFERALEKGIGILPGPVFSAYRERFRNCLRLSCGAPLDRRLERKLRELGRLVADSRSGPTRPG